MKKKKKRIGFQVAEGVVNVFGAAASAVVIVVLMLMLGSLLTWLRQDLAVTFSDISENLTDAVIVTDKVR